MLKENIRRLKGNIQRGFQGDSRFFQPSGQRRAARASPCRPVCEKKLYEKHLLFTNLTIQTNCEGFMVEM